MDWLTPQIQALAWTAMAIGFVHTVLGPDHYIPFIALSKGRNWSLTRTLAITGLCGLGHVTGSVLIGLLGLGAGAALNQMVELESLRGQLASWAMLSFGLVYMAWGIKRAWRNQPHKHLHVHGDGTAHLHEHTHHREHAHPHDNSGAVLGPWAMFIVFVLGPCEALIPILMYPAAAHNFVGMAWVVLIFAAATILTMMGIVALSVRGLGRLKQHQWDRYSHALTGAAISLCGVFMLVGF
jgi:nickel/cobalt exporter